MSYNSEPSGGDTSTDVLQQPGIAEDKGILVDDYGRHVSQPYELGQPSQSHTAVPQQVSAVVSQDVTEVSANKPDDNVLMHMDENVDVAKPSVQSVDDVVRDVIVMDNEKHMQKDAIHVEQTFRGEENTGFGSVASEENQQTEEKRPEIEQEETEIQEKQEIQPERGMDRTEADPHHFTESSVPTIEQTLRPAEEQLPGIQHQVEKAEEIPDSVAANQQQSISIDPSKTHGNILVDAEQYISSSAEVSQEISKADESVTSVEGMETEMTQEGGSEVHRTQEGSYRKLEVAAETNEVVQDKQSQSSSEKPLHPSFELPEEIPPLIPHPTSPLLNPPVQAPTLHPTQPPFVPPIHPQSQQTPSSQPFSLPPNLQSPSHLPHAPSENGSEAQATLPDKPSSPLKVAPHIEPPPKDASTTEPTPQEDIPPKVTSPRGALTLPPTPDPLAEAKAKARSIVEMRERRLIEESQSGTRSDDSGYDVDHYEQEGIPAAESRQVMTYTNMNTILFSLCLQIYF